MTAKILSLAAERRRLTEKSGRAPDTLRMTINADGKWIVSEVNRFGRVAKRWAIDGKAARDILAKLLRELSAVEVGRYRDTCAHPAESRKPATRSNPETCRRCGKQLGEPLRPTWTRCHSRHDPPRDANGRCLGPGKGRCTRRAGHEPPHRGPSGEWEDR